MRIKRPKAAMAIASSSAYKPPVDPLLLLLLLILILLLEIDDLLLPLLVLELELEQELASASMRSLLRSNNTPT